MRLGNFLANQLNPGLLNSMLMMPLFSITLGLTNNKKNNNRYLMNYVNPIYKGTEIVDKNGHTSYSFIFQGRSGNCRRDCAEMNGKCYWNTITLTVKENKDGLNTAKLCNLFGMIKEEVDEIVCYMYSFKIEYSPSGKLHNNFNIMVKEKSKDKNENKKWLQDFDKTIVPHHQTTENGKEYYVALSEN
jgi:hypothetical protein